MRQGNSSRPPIACRMRANKTFGRFNDSQTMTPLYPWRKLLFADADALFMKLRAGTASWKGAVGAYDGLLIWAPSKFEKFLCNRANREATIRSKRNKEGRETRARIVVQEEIDCGLGGIFSLTEHSADLCTRRIALEAINLNKRLLKAARRRQFGVK
jgi:hypothetical protein